MGGWRGAGGSNSHQAGKTGCGMRAEVTLGGGLDVGGLATISTGQGAGAPKPKDLRRVILVDLLLFLPQLCQPPLTEWEGQANGDNDAETNTNFKGECVPHHNRATTQKN